MKRIGKEVTMARQSTFTAKLEGGAPTIEISEHTDLPGGIEVSFTGYDSCYWTLADARVLLLTLDRAIAEADKWVADDSFARPTK